MTTPTRWGTLHVLRARRRLGSTIVAIAVIATALGRPSSTLGQSPPARTLQNGNFEEGIPGSVPPGWFVPTAGTTGVWSSEAPALGRGCAFVTCEGNGSGFCNLMQSIDATSYRGKYIRLSAQVKHTGDSGMARLWLRVDRPGKVPGFFDNMQDRPIVSDQWARYEIAGRVGDDAESLNLGVFVVDGGRAWIDEVLLEALAPVSEADAPPRESSERGLANLIAFARLFGYVRHFHPSDEALAADWERLAMAGVEIVEGAADASELVAGLRACFVPVAPSLRIEFGASPMELALPAGATQWASWRYEGYAPERKDDAGGSPYRARVVRETIEPGGGEHSGTRPGTAIAVELGEGIRALVPIGTYADARRTLPAAEGEPPNLQRPEGWWPRGNDRTVRLSVVILAWNVLQHFYPYFDVVKTDWPGALPPALRRAAVDRNEASFRETLELLGAALQDGHMFVRGPGIPTAMPAVRWEWVGSELVVTAVPGGTIAPAISPGDVVEEINGRPTAEVATDCARHISAATEQRIRWRVLGTIGTTKSAATVRLRVRHLDGTRDEATVPTGLPADVVPEAPLPRDGAEVSPGILYCNLVGAKMDSIAPLLPALAAAKGVVFDLRGYPASAGSQILGHLCTERVLSATWNVPIYTQPGGRADSYDTSRWVIDPKEPHIGGRVFFITDGRAISYAESCLGIVEQYKLGEIVGGPTAGTNGNVVPLSLPGGYGISFTGMQVIKQDGSRHHGVGILPTVPVERTIRGIAEGRDELLEKAIEVASRPAGSGR